MLLCLEPREDRGQQLLDFEIETSPPANLNRETDCFGNTRHLLDLHQKHQILEITTRSTVEVASAPPLPAHLHTSAWEEIHSRRESCADWVPGSTTAESPVEHILETGRGVCQDYAHLMIAIVRSWDIPARYVSGYLHPGEQTPSNATHAWVECRLPALGWVGFDPTNQSFADEGGKVRIAVGRDYRDVSPTRGVLQGGGATHLEVDVRVRTFPIESP